MHHRRQIRRAGRPGPARRLRAGHRQRQGLAATLALAAALALGCGGGGGKGSESDNPDAPLSALTEAERGDLCDFMAGLYGGYGKAFVCQGQTVDQGPANRAACLQEVATWNCAATVGQFESCFTRIGAALAACDFELYASEGMKPDCVAVSPCIEP
jgi:hypothetical protein